MNPAVLAGFVVFLIGAALFLVELWFQPWDPETFWKLIITDGVVLAIVIAGAFVMRERRDTRRMRDRKDLD